MFIGDSSSFTRLLIVGPLAYILVILVLRVSGKRSLSKMNSFDFIVTVSLGSILASILTNENLALLDGILAFSLLLFLQYLTSWLSVRSDFVNSLVKATPRLLFYNGRFDEWSLKKERVSKNEILQAVRSEGHALLDDVQAVVLETDGTFSIIEKTEIDEEALMSLEDVESHKNEF